MYNEYCNYIYIYNNNLILKVKYNIIIIIIIHVMDSVQQNRACGVIILSL